MNRYLARSGVASRRAADGLIEAGEVRVNGRRPPPEGMLIDPDHDQVTVGGRTVTPIQAHRYLALHKPVGVVVSNTHAEGKPTVFDLVASEGEQGRLFAVGRLDVDTSGLLLLTDDGEMANRLAHPRHKVPKEYLAVVAGIPGERALRSLREGVELEDGITAPAAAEVLRVSGRLAEVSLVIKEGRNRQVRRMLRAVGYPVRALHRTGFGPIRLGRLRAGDWRRLRAGELDALFAAAGLKR